MTKRIAAMIDLPAHIEAVVFDVDGVLLDSLAADYDLCVGAAEAVWGDGSWITRALIRTHFALETESFWAELVKAKPEPPTADALSQAMAHYEHGRASSAFPVIEGANALADACVEAGLRIAVASSNAGATLRALLDAASLSNKFEVICGIDQPDVRPKPAPDIYLNAATGLGVAPSQCAFIEDSLTGLQAGREAGYHTAIGVATGPTSVDTLVESGLADVVHDRFAPHRVTLFDGEPTRKTIDTPNDFMSHMVEHIAWRLGVGVDLHWRNTDWRSLGRFVGHAVRQLNLREDAAATLGMIDDGAAETLIDLRKAPGVSFSCHHALDVERVMAMRVEQVRRGADLGVLLEGLSDGLNGHISVRLCSFEDPHHSWEGVFRAVGIGLARLRETA